jgi:alpha-galactosidase/6-phospho-beta-glucosidase family protein
VKICVVGGGSTYTRDLVDGILRARSFRVAGEERTSDVLARYRELLVDQASSEDDPGFAPETRASQVMAIEARLLERYADEALREKPGERLRSDNAGLFGKLDD